MWAPRLPSRAPYVRSSGHTSSDRFVPFLSTLSVEDVLELHREITFLLRCDPINCFPDELLLEIFSYLDAKKLMSCALVSREWYRIACDSALWRSLCFSKYPCFTYSSIGPEKVPIYSTCSLGLANDWRKNYRHLSNTRPLTELARTYYSAAVTTSGELYLSGGLNHDTPMKAPVPTKMNQLSDKKIVAAFVGQLHFAAITDSGQLFTWGCGRHGRLGHGDIDKRDDPTRVAALSHEFVVSASVGVAHSGCVTQQGVAYVWGCAGRGRLGLPTNVLHNIQERERIQLIQKAKELPARPDRSEGEILTPTAICGLANIRIAYLSCGGYHSLALSSDGVAYAWGLGRNGRIGIGSDLTVYEPVALASLKDPVRCISAGWEHSMCATVNGDVYTWGRGSESQLGHPEAADAHRPQLVEGLKDVKISVVSAGGWFSLALSETGDVYSWGRGNAGQLGVGTTDSSSQPRKVDSSHFGNVPIVAISGGPLHSVAVSSLGQYYTWGRGKEGQLGDGLLKNVTYPQRIDFVDHTTHRPCQIVGTTCPQFADIDASSPMWSDDEMDEL